MLVVVVMRVPIEPGEREREREAERQKKRSFGVVHAGSLLGHSKKNANRKRKAVAKKEFILSSVFHARKNDDGYVNRTASRMENQCVDSREKKRRSSNRRNREKRKKRNCSHHSNIFAYKQTFIDIFYVYRYIFSYIFPFEINVEKKKKYLPN